MTVDSQKRFRRVHVEITNICNVQCSFCPEVQRENQSMNLHQFKAVIDQVAPLTEQVCFHLMGEPLAHQSLSQFFNYCSKKNVSVNLTTNGLLLKSRVNDLIEAQALRQINISLQSFHDNFPEKSLEVYLNKVLVSLDSLMQSRPDVYINLRLWNDGVEDNENEEVFTFLEKRYSLVINRRVDVAFRKSKKLFGKLYLNFDSRFDWPDLSLPHLSEFGTCYGLQNHIGILSDGTFVPCCLDKEAAINLGNVFENSIEELLSQSRVEKMVSGFQKGQLVEDLCQRCQFVQRFDKKSHVASVKNSVGP